MSQDLQMVAQDIYDSRGTFASVLCDKTLNFEREAGFAIQVLQDNPFALKVAKGNRQSLVDAVTNVAAIGVSLNPAKKLAYLVPRKGKICLDISYMGMLDIAMQSGSIRWGQAQLVYESDTFEYTGVDTAPRHTFDPFRTDRGEVVGVYVVAKTVDGDYLTEMMSTSEINDIRNRSEAFKSGRTCPWATDWGEMARKTVVKRGQKYWPKTDRLDQAIHYMNNDGGEGVSNEPAPQNPEMVQSWIERFESCESSDALGAAWKEAVNEVKSMKDRPAYDALKAAVEKRGAEIRQAEANTYEGEAQ